MGPLIIIIYFFLHRGLAYPPSDKANKLMVARPRIAALALKLLRPPTASIDIGILGKRAHNLTNRDTLDYSLMCIIPNSNLAGDILITCSLRYPRNALEELDQIKGRFPFLRRKKLSGEFEHHPLTLQY